MSIRHATRIVVARFVSVMVAFLMAVAVFVAVLGVLVREAQAVDCHVPAGYATIQAAVDDLGCTTIYVAAGTYAEHVTIGRDVSIVGDGASSTIIDGGGLDRVVTIGGGSVVISGTRIENGFAGSTGPVGGGVYVDSSGALYLQHSVVRSNVVTGTSYGGGIANAGVLTLTNTLVSDNLVEEAAGIVYGGGLSNHGDAWVLEDTVIDDNGLVGSQAYGGGLYNDISGTLTLRGSTVRENALTATIAYGGGLQNDGVMVVEGTNIDSNTIDAMIGHGAGVLNGDVMTMTDSVVRENVAPDGGGGLFNAGALSIEQSTLRQNTSHRGGGLYNSGALTMAGSRVLGNMASDGAGIQGGNVMTITHSMVMSNTASDDGGGIYSSSSLMLADSVVAFNNATNEGAGLYTWDMDRLVNSAIMSNTSSNGNGAGVYQVNGSHITATNVTISRNRGNGLSAAGGAWYSDGELSTAELANTTIVSNSVAGAANSGGLYLGSVVTVTLQNSIVAHNSYSNCDGPREPVSGGHNLESANDCGLKGAGDQIGLVPLLGAPALNGGQTPTHALLSGSPAVDAGDSGLCPATDQRGVSRASGAACDVGAYEVVQASTVGVSHVEGEAGASTAVFTVTLSAASPITEQVVFSTTAGTATAGVDYAPVNEVLIFAPDEVQATVGVTVFGDTVDEGNETFEVVLEALTGAHVVGAPFVGVIVDDEAWEVWLPLVSWGP